MLKLMTINVWSGLTYKGLFKMKYYESRARREARYQALLASIREQQPDVIGLSEANPCPDYLERLARDLDYDYCYHMGASGVRLGRCGLPVNFREGDAILARRGLRLKYRGRKHLGGEGIVRNLFSWHTYDHTQLVLASIEVQGRELYIAQTHWHASPILNQQTRDKAHELAKDYPPGQLEQALKFLQRDELWKLGEARRTVRFLQRRVPVAAPLVLMGDFNAEMHWTEMRMLSEAGFVDAHEVAGRDDGYTWNMSTNLNLMEHYQIDGRMESLYEHLHTADESEPRVIDHILFNGDRNCIKSAALCCDKLYAGVHASDHYGVVVQLEL